MAREDIEIKGEIIGELEDIEDPTTGLSLLEAVMVERVDVEKGKASLTLIFEDDLAKDVRWALEDEIHDAIEDIEGLEDISIHGVLRSIMNAEYAQAAREREAALAAEASGEDGAATDDTTEDSSATYEAEVDLEDTPAKATQSPEDTDEPGGFSVYNGGGCASGTVQEPTPSVAPKTLPTPPVSTTPKPTPVPPSQSAATLEHVAINAEGQVTIDLATYTALVQDQRELSLRPSIDEYNSLKQRYDLLQSKVQSLQDAIRAFLRT